MSATLTTKRKSARDRPASSTETLREWGDWGRESGRLTEELEAGRRRVTSLAEMTNARGRALRLPAACEGAEVGTVSLTPINSVRARFNLRQSLNSPSTPSRSP